jgi:hypothetical protein
MNEDEITAYLDDNGYPPHIVKGGGRGLVGRWSEFVSEVERGYQYRLDDYRRDLDLRGVIELTGLGEEAVVQEADARLREMLVNTNTRMWESSAANGFWDFGFPRNAGGRLLRDLRSELDLSSDGWVEET